MININRHYKELYHRQQYLCNLCVINSASNMHEIRLIQPKYRAIATASEHFVARKKCPRPGMELGPSSSRGYVLLIELNADNSHQLHFTCIVLAKSLVRNIFLFVGIKFFNLSQSFPKWKTKMDSKIKNKNKNNLSINQNFEIVNFNSKEKM